MRRKSWCFKMASHFHYSIQRIMKPLYRWLRTLHSPPRTYSETRLVAFRLTSKAFSNQSGLLEIAYCVWHGFTYAAVAAKISTRRAFVVSASASEKQAEKAVMTPNFSALDDTKNRTTIESIGSNDATTVVKISAAPKRKDFS